MNLAALHREKAIQPHHWQAAKWLQAECELHSPRSPAMMEVARRCRDLEAIQGGPGIDPFSLMLKACVKQEPFTSNERVVGILREALNIVHRVVEQRGLAH